MKLGRIIFEYFGFITLTAWVIGFFVFALSAIGLKYTPTKPADAIIVLTGGSDRIQTGIQLLQNNLANKLFISGVNPSVRPNTVLNMAPTELQDKIALGYIADSTHTNAMETATWIRDNKIESALLVTSFYHMPRSLLEMKHRISGMQLIPHSIFPTSFDESTQWIHTKYAWHLFVEYHKFIVTYLHYLL